MQFLLVTDWVPFSPTAKVFSRLYLYMTAYACSKLVYKFGHLRWWIDIP